MVKKKSFWLTLLAVLTAAVLVFSACGLAACSSEGEGDGNEGGATVTSVALDNSTLSLTVGGSAGSLKATVTMSDSSDYAGSYTWSSDKESVATVTGNGASATVTAVAEGSATITVAVSDSKSASCTVSVSTGSTNPDTGETGLLVALQGYYGVFGIMDYWAEVEIYTDGTGIFNTVNADGSLYEDFCGTLDWQCEEGYDIDDDYVELDSYITLSQYGRIGIPGSLARVNGEIVASYFSIAMISSESIFYSVGVTAALESKGNVGDEHAKVVLYDDTTAVVQIDGEIEEGTWAWSANKDNVTITTDSGTYETSSIVANSKDQITSAVFTSFGGVSNLTFLQILDANLEEDKLYQFVSSEGYTLVIYVNATFESVVGDTTYSGLCNTTSFMLRDSETEEQVSPATDGIGYDEDGNVISLTYATYFGDTTDVYFELGVPFNREDSANYQKYYKGDWDSETYEETVLDENGDPVLDDEGEEVTEEVTVPVDHGEALAVLVGHAYKDDENGDPVAQEDDTDERWLFIYRDGTFIAHVTDASDTFTTTGIWTWEADDDGNVVPTIVRNPNSDNQRNHAYQNSDGTWSVDVEDMWTSMQYIATGIYYIYTFDINDFPAGAFEGTNSSGTATVYLVLNYDGTLTAHINSGLMTSSGVWSKDETGKMTFYKTNSSGTISALCDTTVDDSGIYTVVITNALGTKYTYTVDPSVVPVGGHVYTDEDKAIIDGLEAEAQGSGEEQSGDVTYVEATLYTESFTVYGITASDVTLSLGSDGSASLDLTMFGSPMSYSNCSYTITGDSISLTVSGLGTTSTGTIAYDADGTTILTVVFTNFAGMDQNVTFTASTT